MAASAAGAMATALGVEFGFATVLRADAKSSLIAMLLGALVAMLGAMALISAGGAWAKVRTAAFFPIAIGLGMMLGVGVGGHTDLMLGIFVVVMFASVFVRRFGIAFFFYGFMGWLGYFFASFLNATLALMPFLIAAVALGSAWVLLLSLTILRANPARTLRRTVNAFDARARGLLRDCAELLRAGGGGGPRRQKRLRRRIHGRQRRLAEAALMVEGWSGEPAALPSDQSAATLRQELLEAQQALDALIETAQALAETGGGLCPAAAEIAERLAYRDDAGAARDAEELKKALGRRDHEFSDAGADGSAWRTAWRFAAAAIVFVALARAARRPDRSSERARANEADEFEPVVSLAMGNLPGSAAVARGLPGRGAGWNPLARMDLVTRQAIQVAVAGGLAILAGRALSPTRYYWAVIAAFIMFSGTTTRSETFLKGLNRVLGTTLGLFAAVGLAELTAGHPIWIVVTIVASMFFGFYLIRVSYAYMIFFVTIMVAQLYTVFHEFTPGLLLLRLEETAIGAGLGFLVALFLIPLSTRDTVRAAREAALSALAQLLNAAGDRFERAATKSAGEDAPAGEGDRAPSNLYALSRALDDRLRRFALVAKPLTGPLVGGGNFVAARHRLGLYAAIGTDARALVVVLEALPTAVPDGNRLAGVCRRLASAGARLAEAKAGQGVGVVADPLAEAETVLSEADPIVADARSAERIVQPLRQLLYVLKSLNTSP
jgi:uncharacterized membrane protein YccC